MTCLVPAAGPRELYAACLDSPFEVTELITALDYEIGCDGKDTIIRHGTEVNLLSNDPLVQIVDMICRAIPAHVAQPRAWEATRLGPDVSLSHAEFSYLFVLRDCAKLDKRRGIKSDTNVLATTYITHVSSDAFRSQIADQEAGTVADSQLQLSEYMGSHSQRSC